MTDKESKKMNRVWILEEGAYYSDRGLVVVVAKSKAGLLKWIKDNYPNHKRDRRDKNELFFENDNSQTWLKCGDCDRCPIID